MEETYILKSERLGFRAWQNEDLEEFAQLNADSEVMEHFPKPLSKAETAEFIQRLQKHYVTHGYNYFAVEILETGELIGFIGLAYQSYETEFNPATDMGWRLKKSAWGKGYATEAAIAIKDALASQTDIEHVSALAVEDNIGSICVMKKIGMQFVRKYEHKDPIGDFTAVHYQMSVK